MLDCPRLLRRALLFALPLVAYTLGGTSRGQDESSSLPPIVARSMLPLTNGRSGPVRFYFSDLPTSSSALTWLTDTPHDQVVHASVPSQWFAETDGVAPTQATTPLVTPARCPTWDVLVHFWTFRQSGTSFRYRVPVLPQRPMSSVNRRWQIG